MNISNPFLPAHIKQSAQNTVNDLYSSHFSENNVDLDISFVGILNYTTGVKLRLSFVDCFEDDDVDECRRIALQNGATNVKTKINTSTGNIDLNIEYKRKKSNINIWIIRVLLVLVMVWLYHQLHLKNPEKYQMPSLQ